MPRRGGLSRRVCNWVDIEAEYWRREFPLPRNGSVNASHQRSNSLGITRASAVAGAPRELVN